MIFKKNCITFIEPSAEYWGALFKVSQFSKSILDVRGLQELCNFYSFSCVLIHGYFSAMIFERFFCEGQLTH